MTPPIGARSVTGGTYFGAMEENRARRVADALRARGINAHFAEVGTYQFGVRVTLPGGRVAEWDTDGTAGLENSELVLPDRPGLGLAFREDTINRFTVAA